MLLKTCTLRDKCTGSGTGISMHGTVPYSTLRPSIIVFDAVSPEISLLFFFLDIPDPASGLVRKPSGLNFSPEPHFWRNPTILYCSGALGKVTLCVRRGARKRSRFVRYLTSPDFFLGDLRENSVDKGGHVPFVVNWSVEIVVSKSRRSLHLLR